MEPWEKLSRFRQEKRKELVSVIKAIVITTLAVMLLTGFIIPALLSLLESI